MSYVSYAGFWKRFAALIIDLIIINIGGFVFGFVFGIVMVSIGVDDIAVLKGMANIISIVLAWLYFAVMESSTKQGTIGKIILGIKVTDIQGERISFSKATGRYFGRIVSVIILMIGFIMIAFTEKKQGLHDMMTGCLVVNRNNRETQTIGASERCKDEQFNLDTPSSRML